MRRLVLLAALLVIVPASCALGETWHKLTLPEGPSNPTPTILGIAADDGEMWVSTKQDGIMGYDGTEWVVDTYTNSGLRSNAYHYVMFIDSTGDKWAVKPSAATADRLNDGGTFSDRSDDVWTYYSTPAQFFTSSVFSMVEDQAGNKWFGVGDENNVEPCVLELLIENGEGTADDQWLYLGGEFEPDIFRYDVRALAVDPLNRLWIAYGRYGVDALNFDDYESFGDYTLTHYEMPDGLPSNSARAVCVDASGRVWLGTLAGVAYLEPGESHWRTVAGTEELIVADLDVDEQGHVWAATNEGVLMMLGGVIVARYGTQDGLADEFVDKIAVDRTNGTVWAVSVDHETSETELNTMESGFGPGRDIFAYPNPWRQGSENGVTLLGAPSGSTVDVLDITGQRLRRLEAGEGPLEWDSLDESGKEVPSGMYILRVDIPGEDAVFTKVAIIR
jgi:hypothetical protein